jgi:hypothetical protein
VNDRDNYLRTASLTGGEWIPSSIHISGASWRQLRKEAEEVLARHPVLFPGFEKGKLDFDNPTFGPAYREELYFDNWGCGWDNLWGGLEGQVKVHPLADDAAFDSYHAPDPLAKSERGDRGDWDEIRANATAARERGDLVMAHADRFYERIHFLRGFGQLMIDFATEPPTLPRLIDIVFRHNMRLVEQWLDIGFDVITFGDDFGTQTAAMMSPATFDRWLAPSYARMMQACRRAGAHVYLHSDGYIMELMDSLLRCGVSIINPQDLCNGIDDLAREVKGRVCISLDIDRQRIIPFGTRQEIRELIEEEVVKLGSPRGGLMFVAGIYPPTPAENVDALCCALEEFRTYWWDGRG